MDGMTIPGLLARAADWLLEVKVDGDRLNLRQVAPCDPPPEELLHAILHERKAEVLEWLDWDRRAGVLWRAVFYRLRGRVDLPSDPKYKELEGAAEAAHRRHDRPALLDALLDLESYANRTRVQP